MPTIDLDSTDYFGTTSRPGTNVSIDHSCRRCGTSLAGRFERIRWATIEGNRCLVDVYRCRCGAGRWVRRPAEATTGGQR